MERGSEKQRFPWIFVLGWDPHKSEPLEWNVPGMKSPPLPTPLLPELPRAVPEIPNMVML